MSPRSCSHWLVFVLLLSWEAASPSGRQPLHRNRPGGPFKGNQSKQTLNNPLRWECIDLDWEKNNSIGSLKTEARWMGLACDCRPVVKLLYIYWLLGSKSLWGVWGFCLLLVYIRGFRILQLYSYNYFGCLRCCVFVVFQTQRSEQKKEFKMEWMNIGFVLYQCWDLRCTPKQWVLCVYFQWEVICVIALLL